MTPGPSAGPLKVLAGMPLAGLDGGSERLLANLLPRAPAAGLALHVVFFEEGPLVERARAAGLRATVIPVERHNDPVAGLRAIRRLRSMIRAERPDVVLSWLARAHLWMAPAAVAAGARRRLVWWQHHIARGERLETLVGFLPARRVIATSAAAAAAQARRRPHRSCVVVHPGIEPPVASADGVAALRRRYALPGRAKVVGTVGRLVRWKGQDRFIEAVAFLLERDHDITAMIVGGESYGIDVGYRAELRELARSRGLEDRIVFTGHVPDPHDHVALLDVLVSASDGEPFGLTLIEAMALGTPVVAVAAAGPLEIVEDGRSGVLVPDGRPASIAAGVERVLSDPALAERLKSGGRDRFEAEFSVERMAAETARALRAVAAQANGDLV